MTTTHPPPSSILDLTKPKTHPRIPLTAFSPTTPHMPTRSAEEAELPPDDTARSATRQRTAQDEQDHDTDMPEDNALDILSYVATPALDPLHIHGWDSHTTTDNLSAFQITSWNNEPGAKALAYKAYGGRIDERDEITKLRELIKSTLSLTNNPTIAPPSPETDRGKRDTNPVCALVKGIRPEEIQELLDRVSPKTPHK